MSFTLWITGVTNSVGVLGGSPTVNITTNCPILTFGYPLTIVVRITVISILRLCHYYGILGLTPGGQVVNMSIAFLGPCCRAILGVVLHINCKCGY
jgi:hypothetical protein